jgi:UDP-N-acetylglucosamine diphosphorylase/glucosamine-1-phosphate N-acetyltransferase
MLNLILFDGNERDHLLPLTFTRPVADLRIGILTIAEKWGRILETTPSILTQPILQPKYPLTLTDDNLLVNGSICPNLELLGKIIDLKLGEALFAGAVHIASRLDAKGIANLHEHPGIVVNCEVSFVQVSRLWHLFQYNGVALEADFQMLTDGRTSAPIADSNTLIGDRVFLEPGAQVNAAILNSTSGPIYIGRDAEVMEGSIVRGGLALCDHSQLKLGAKIYGPTTIGPHSKVGGEVNNSVIWGYSNKGHDGFLGNSVLGAWCNLGADTNNSNLKNNYDEVKLWSYRKGGFERTGLQFCGLFMGDHSKCGINTMFNTGTVVGVSANIFGSGFPRNIISSFAWGGAAGFTPYQLDKALDTANRVMARRGLSLDDQDRAIMQAIWEQDGQKN